MNKSQNYHDKVDIDNQIKLRELLKTLPSFCKTFFYGIEPVTASRTRIAYAYDLTIFFNYIKDNNPKYKNMNMCDIPIDILDELKVTDIEEYMQYLKVYLKNENLHTNREKGIKRKISSLKSFYNYYFNNELIHENPAAKVKVPKLHEKEIVRLDPNEVADLLDMVESGEKLTDKQKAFHKKTKVRDVALMTLLLGTGIRVSECVGIDIDDIDFDNTGIKIRRKGGYETVVYFSDEVKSAVLTYYDERKKIIPVSGHENAFFLSMQKKRMSVRSVENLVSKYSGLVTKLKHITPHKLRSTYGTSLYRQTGDIYLVADVLGHKDVNTTRKHYAAQEDERKWKARNAVKLRED